MLNVAIINIKHRDSKMAAAHKHIFGTTNRRNLAWGVPPSGPLLRCLFAYARRKTWSYCFARSAFFLLTTTSRRGRFFLDFFTYIFHWESLPEKICEFWRAPKKSYRNFHSHDLRRNSWSQVGDFPNCVNSSEPKDFEFLLRFWCTGWCELRANLNSDCVGVHEGVNFAWISRFAWV